MNPVLVAAGVLLFGICAFDIMGVLVRMERHTQSYVKGLEVKIK